MRMNLFEQYILNRGMEYCEDVAVSDLEIIDDTVRRKRIWL